MSMTFWAKRRRKKALRAKEEARQRALDEKEQEAKVVEEAKVIEEKPKKTKKTAKKESVDNEV